MAATPTPAQVLSLLGAGRAAEALQLAHAGAAQNPADAAWLRALGLALHASGRSRDAAHALEAALRIAPDDASLWALQGAIAAHAGDAEAGERALREALRREPRAADARFNLALLLRARGELAAAAAELDAALAVRHELSAAQVERAAIALDLGDAQQAWDRLQAVLAREPRHGAALATACAAAVQLGMADAVSALSARLLALASADPVDLAWVAQSLAAAGRHDASLEAARKAAALAPDAPDVRERVANVLEVAGLDEEARTHYAYVARRRNDGASLGKLAAAALRAGDAAAAAQAAEALVRRDPRDRQAVQHLATALAALRHTAQAKRVLHEALGAGLRDAELLATLVRMKARTCDWEDLDALVAELRRTALVPSDRPAFPPIAMYLPGVTAREQRTWARNWARVRFPSPPPMAPARRASSAGPLTVGFLSGELRDHATSHLMAAMLERHDRARFRFIAYSHGRDDGSAMRRRIAAAFDAFVEVGGLSSAATAARIRDDGVDVLIDLSGYLERSRLDVLAYRAAPVQGHFLGYPATTGAPFVDFFVADAVTIPPGEDDTFTERILRMPASYQPNEYPAALPPAPARSACGLPAQGVVFCSFNQPVKITADGFDRWCALLRAVPDACLWLAAMDDETRANLCAQAAARAVDPARLVFAPVLERAAHLARLGHADLAIDTFPCTSHTTAADALCAGVPLVTARGDTFASRVASSVLHAAGLGDFSHPDPDAAMEASLALARDAAALGRARERTVASRGSALFDAAAYCAAFEGLLEEAARAAARGRGPGAARTP